MPSSSRVCYQQPGPPPPPTAASCYICSESSIDDNNQPLLRNCACRGDAGWAHVACLAKFAASKVTEAQSSDPSVDIVSIWENCILCKTPHMQNVGLAIAEAFVEKYEHLPDNNQLRFLSLYSLANSRFDVDDPDGAFELCDRLLKVCDVPTSEDVRCSKGNVLSLMGAVFVRKQQFEDAVLAYERLRELLVSVYGHNSPRVKENNIKIVTLKERIGIGVYGHQKKGDTAAELIRARELFRENQECVDIRERLYIHSELVGALSDDGRHQEAMEQLEKLLAESRQSLGPNHPDTLLFENAKYRFPLAVNSSAASKKIDVWAVIDCVVQQPAISGQRVKVLRATKDAQKYVCLIKNNKGVSTKFKVAQHQFILEAGTTVVVHGLVSSTDLNGSIGIIHSFDKEKRQYAVSVGKKKTVSIKPINLNIVFN